jgi:hypothetical protein
MSKLLAVSIACVGIGLGVWAGSGAARGGASSETYVVRVGDRVRVLDVPIACRVVHVRELGRRVALDCRRGGPLAGTYGTLLTEREAALVDFETSRRAKVLAVARHDGDVHRCMRTP